MVWTGGLIYYGTSPENMVPLKNLSATGFSFSDGFSVDEVDKLVDGYKEAYSWLMIWTLELPARRRSSKLLMLLWGYPPTKRGRKQYLSMVSRHRQRARHHARERQREGVGIYGHYTNILRHRK